MDFIGKLSEFAHLLVHAKVFGSAAPRFCRTLGRLLLLYPSAGQRGSDSFRTQRLRCLVLS